MTTLVVIIRDVSPLIHFGDAVEHRMIAIELTDEQKDALELRWLGVDRGRDIYEQLATCFLQDTQDIPHQKPTK